jgi:hypothetical protein
MLLEGLHRIDNHQCDDILRDIFLEGRMSRSIKSIAAQLLYFTSLLEHSGPGTPKDIMIIERLLKELKGLRLSVSSREAYYGQFLNAFSNICERAEFVDELPTVREFSERLIAELTRFSFSHLELRDIIPIVETCQKLWEAKMLSKADMSKVHSSLQTFLVQNTTQARSEITSKHFASLLR